VNPLATILAAKMMLEWLGERDQAAEIETAVAAVVAEGVVRTYDLGGRATTAEMAQAVSVKVGQAVSPAMAVR
jgi:3-isopropylmalate dehydrogenase